MPLNRRVFIVAAAAMAFPVASKAKSKDPIRLAIGDDLDAQLMAALAAKALRKSGFKVEMIEIGDGQALDALISGAVHAHVSLPRSGALEAAIDDKAVRSLGGRVGNKRDEPVLKLVSVAMKKKWPDAQKLLKRMVLSDARLAELSALVAGGASVDDAVDAWWKANRKTWSPWIAASKNWMKP